MELVLEESAEKPVSTSGQQNPPEDEWWWKAEKKAHNNTKRDCSEPQHNEQSQRPPPASEHTKGFSETQKSEAVISETQQKLETDWSRLAAEKCLKSNGQGYEKLPVANQAYVDTGLLAAKPSILAETRQPQIFSLSTDLSRRDAPTERATNSLDIYEVDWRTLQFQTPFADDTLINRQPTASVAGRSLACHLVWEATTHEEQGTAQPQGRHSFSRRASDHHPHAPPNIPFAHTLEENSTLQIKAPYRVCSPYAANSPTACDQGRTHRRTPGNAAIRRSASWERMRASYRRLHRGRSVPREKSASVSEKRLYLGSDCFRHTDPSAANRVPQLLPPACRAWALLPVCHTFSRLATVNCSGTPLESEALQAFAGLVCLKNLVLAGCNLKDVNFLTCFVGAVPLQRLIVPFNKVDTLLVRNCTQASVFSADDGDESRSISTSVYTGSALELEGAASLAVAQKELSSAKPYQGKDLQTVTAKRGAIHLADPGLTKALQCVQTREVDQGCEDQEGVSEHDNSAIYPDRKEKDPVQGDSSTGIKGTGKCTPEEHEEVVAEITLGETSGQHWRGGRSTKNILQGGKPGLVNSSATANVFPASLLLVDLSYNCLSDARELLPFSSNFGELRTLKVSGNFFHTEPSSLLMQVKRTLTSKRINFECGNQLMKKETKQGFLGDLSGRSLCTGRMQTALSENSPAAAFSQSCQKPVNIGKLERKHAYVSATSPSAGDELQRLQELVKRLAREKATLAEELKQARQQTRPGRHEKSPTSPTKIAVCDRERNICALPQRYEETSGLGDRLNREGAEAHLSQGCETDAVEKKSARLRQTLQS